MFAEEKGKYTHVQIRTKKQTNQVIDANQQTKISDAGRHQ